MTNTKPECCNKCRDIIPEGPYAGEVFCNATDCPCHSRPEWEEELDKLEFLSQVPNWVESAMRTFLKETAEKAERRGAGTVVDYILAQFPKDTSPDAWRAFTQVFDPSEIVRAALSQATKEV